MVCFKLRFCTPKSAWPVGVIGVSRQAFSGFYNTDLVRFIVLRKYGGIYTDLDNIFIKEMSPLCGSSFFYYWSDSDACAESF